MNKILENKPRLIFGIGFFVISIITIISLLIAGESTNNIFATLGDKEITKTKYEDFLEKCEAMAKYNESDDSASCSDSALEDLIFEAGLEREAEKRGITVDENELEEQYQSLVESYGNEETLITTYSQNFKYNKGDIIRALKVEQLQEKLYDQLINSKDLTGLYVRWDHYNDPAEENTEKIQKLKNETTVALVKKYYLPIIATGSTPELNSVAAKLRNENQQFSYEAMAGAFEVVDLNEESEKRKFEGREDWEAIKKLTKVGDVSEIVKSSGGYTAVYRLDKVTSGSFPDWESYKKSLIEEAKVQPLAYKINENLKIAANVVKSKVAILNNYLIPKASATVYCGNNHFSALNVTRARVWGTSGATSTNIPSISVSWAFDGYGDACTNPGSCSGDIACSGTFTTPTSGSSSWLVGSERNSDRQDWLNCYDHWNVTLTKSGYYGIRWVNKNVDPNGSTTNLDKSTDNNRADFQERVGGTWGSASEELENYNTDNNGYIYMRPVPAITPSCSISASPSTINRGGSSTLTWSTTNATSASINNSIGTVDTGSNKTRSVSPTSTTTYTMTVTSSTNHTNTCATTVTVNQPKTLTITRAGDGSGTVTSSPTGINCGTDCSESYTHGTDVTITAAPAISSNFVSWGGACSGTSTTCTLDMTENRSVTATFNLKVFNITYNKNTAQAVTNMPSNGTVKYNQTYTIPNNIPTRADGYTFIAWRTSCSSDTVCSGNSYQPGGTIPNVTSNTTLRAQWNTPPTATATQTQVNNETIDVGTIANDGALNITTEKTHVRLDLTVTDDDGDRVRVIGASYRKSDNSEWSLCGRQGTEASPSWDSQPRTFECNTATNLVPGRYLWSFEVGDERGAERIYHETLSFNINPPTCSFTPALPPKINEDEAATVIYNTNQAWKAEVSNDIGGVVIGSAQSFTTRVLTETVTYWMTVTGSGDSTDTCNADVRVKKLACDVTPRTGPVSLVVLARAVEQQLTGEGNFIYKFRVGTSLSTAPFRTRTIPETSLNHTFTNPGTYLITVSHPAYKGGLVERECSVVIASDPSTDEGGEVAP